MEISDDIFNYVKDNPNSIQVDIHPYPNLIAAVSNLGEKYVKSEKIIVVQIIL